MKYIVTYFLFFGGYLFAQNTGYFGSKNRFSLSVSGLPTINNTFSYDESVGIASSRLRLAFLTYNLDYNLAIAKRTELTLGYSYSNVRMYSILKACEYVHVLENEDGIKNSIVAYYPYLEDLNYDYHQYNFGFKFYRLGSVAPVGKFIGFNFAYGQAKVDTTDISIGIKNIAYEVSNWSSKSTVFKEYVSNVSLDYKTFQFVLRIGRNYVINKHLSFGGEILIPVLTFYALDSDWRVRSPEEFVRLPEISNILESSARNYNFLKLAISLNVHI
jgi:hypothetical protein